MIEKLDNFLNQKKFFPYIIILAFLSIGIIFEPAILGSWESINYYYNFAQLQTPLDFRISPRGNIADPAFFFLGFSRILCDFFNFESSVSNFRYLAIIYGVISIFLFFLISKRWFGASASLVSSILLSVNPVFHFYQHSMIVLIISFMSFLFFLERLQTLDYSYNSNLSWFGLSLSLVLVIIHYGPGRIFSLIFLSLWLFKFIYSIKNYPKSKYIIKNVFLKLGITILISTILLGLLDWKNLLSIIRFYNIIFPTDSEVIFLRLGDTSLSDTIFLNAKLLMESLTGLGNKYHSTELAYLGANFRYPILNPILFSLLIGGIIVCFLKFNKKVLFFSKPYLSSLVLFLTCLLPLFFSSIVEINEKGAHAPSLSNYRIFYLLIPSYLLIAAFLNYIFKKKGNKKIYFTFFLILFFSFYIASINNLNKNYKNFNTKLNNINYKIHGLQSYNQWKDGTIHTNFRKKNFRHNQLHAQYYNIAKKVRNKLDVNNKNYYYILNVDVKQFSEKAMHYFDIFNFNHHSIFFSIYLNSFGVTSAWIQMIDLNLPKKPLVRYTQGKFSAPLILKNDKMQYVKSPGFKGYLHYFSNTVPNVIVATTYEELVFASNFLKKNDFNFIIIDL